MSDKKKITKPAPISGYPEWTPEVRLVEQQWFDHIRNVFESYGFCSLETPSVEDINVIAAKGEVDKEIYVLERLHKEEEDDGDARLALHFDLTVPLARYVAQHFNDLVFPFKRYQMQRVWRGERPQAGRFREFYQCDIDVINVDHLPLHFDAEMPAVIWEVLKGLPGMENENIQIRINNRKILTGLCEAYDIKNITDVTRAIDKLEKIGEENTKQELQQLGLTAKTADELLNIIQNKNLEDIPVHLNDTVADGYRELSYVKEFLSQVIPQDAFVIDLSIVRGLDYYTGTVYETVFVDDPGYGSICSGGRYDDLASQYINKKLPGVGISIGFSRLFARLLDQGKLPVSRKSPADILMVLPNEEQRAIAAETARKLRDRGFKVEMYHAPQKLKKQLAYAEKKGIPYVWFPPFEDGQDHEVKSMHSGEQKTDNPEDWSPDT